MLSRDLISLDNICDLERIQDSERILTYCHTAGLKEQQNRTPTLTSQQLLERIKLVFPRGIGHKLTGATTFALMREEHDCKFSFETFF